MNEISPLKEATLRRREEAIYPLRKVFQGEKVKYQFREAPPDERTSQQELVVRFPSPEATEAVQRKVDNVFKTRGFQLSPVGDFKTYNQLFDEADGFQTRVHLILLTSEDGLLTSILVKAEPA